MREGTHKGFLTRGPRNCTTKYPRVVFVHRNTRGHTIGKVGRLVQRLVSFPPPQRDSDLFLNMAKPVEVSLNDTYLTPSHSGSTAKLLKLHHS